MAFVIETRGVFRGRTKFINNIYVNSGLKGFYSLKVEW
jgi:hypothetical protein